MCHLSLTKQLCLNGMVLDIANYGPTLRLQDRVHSINHTIRGHDITFSNRLLVDMYYVVFLFQKKKQQQQKRVEKEKLLSSVVSNVIKKALTLHSFLYWMAVGIFTPLAN